MSTKIALITGGTSGIGLSIVKHLVKDNWKVYFIGSNAARGEAVQESLTTLVHDQVTFVQLDLSDPESVIRFTEEFQQRENQLDLLANIAGGLFPNREVSDCNVEKNFAISYLSAYILSTELSPSLRNAESPRIVNVSANPKMMLKKQLEFENLNLDHDYSAFKASTRAVHAKTVLTQILAEKYANQIDVNAFDPGMVKSGLGRRMPWPFRLLSKLIFAFAPKDSEEGIRLCTSQAFIGKSGNLYSIENTHRITFDREYRNALLQVTNEMLKDQSTLVTHQ